jgi:WD40 repeat protein
LAVGLALVAPAVVAQEISTAPVLRIEPGMHSAQINDAATDRAGDVLVTGSNDKTARIWTLPELRLVRVLRPPIGPGIEGLIGAVAMAPDGNTVAVGGPLSVERGQFAVDLFDVGSGRLIRQFKTDDFAFALAFSHDGGRLAVGLGKKGVQVWRLADGALQGEDPDYRSLVQGLDFAADGRLAAASDDGAVRLYDAALHRLARQTTQAGQQPFRVRFSPDGKDLAIGFNGKTAVEVRSASDLSLRAQPDVSGLNDDGLGIVGWSDGSTVLAGGAARLAADQTTTPIFAWAQRGVGPRRVAAPAFRSTVSAILALPGRGEGLAAASFEPSIGVFVDGRPQAFHPDPEVDLRPWRDSDVPAGLLFRVSDDGSVIETDYGGSRDRPLRFDGRGLTVKQLDTPTLGLTSWQPAERGLRAELFMSRSPKLNGRPLALAHGEYAYAIDVRRDQALLGTNFFLRLFGADSREVWPRPVSVPYAWRVAQSPDGRLVVAALGDGTVRWYRASDGAELLAFFVHSDGKRWVAFTPSGYYAASPGGEDLIGWQINEGANQAADFFPASRYRERFYRPDVVALVLKTLDETEAVQQANTAHGAPAQPAPSGAELKDAVLQERPPVVSIISPSPGTQLSDATAELLVEVRSPSGRPITRVEARLNGRPATGAEVGQSQPVPTARGEVAEKRRIVVPVPAGEPATIEVIAWSGERASDAVGLEVRGRTPAIQGSPEPSQPLRQPRLNAVLIGVSAYGDEKLRLLFAAKDAEDLAVALKKQEGGLYREVNVNSRVDAQVTRNEILEQLIWLQRNTTQEDLALVFLAGHGASEDEEYYFLTADADEETMTTKGVSGTDLRHRLRQIPGRTVVFVDTCYAGALAAGMRDVQPDITKLLNELSGAEAGVAVYSATTGRQRAQELSTLQNGVFTRAILDALSGAAGQPADGALRLNVLAEELADRVKTLTGGKQAATYNALRALRDTPLFLVRQ